jgi:hypothetical protein
MADRADRRPGSARPRRCIYCLEDKPIAAFNREHVIPQSYGRFDGNNLVLDCVCTSCNTEFGKTIDEKLARDSIEAIERVRIGLKKAAEYRSLGRRSTTEVAFDLEGPMRGARGYYVPGEEGLGVTPLPQIGFAHSVEETPVWYRIPDVPTKEWFIENGYPRGTTICIRTWGMPIDQALDVLESRGFARHHNVEEVQAPPRTTVKVVAIISRPELRAVTKIALNYLAAVTSPAIARMSQFNEARRYARFDVDPSRPAVEVAANPWIVDGPNGEPAMGHYISLSSRGGRVTAQVSLLLRMRYLVTLDDGGSMIPFDASSAHFFDLDTKTVSRIRSPPP